MVHDTIGRVCTLPDQEEVQLPTLSPTYHCIIIRCATLEFGGYHFNQDEMYTYVHTMIVIEFLTEETTCVIMYKQSELLTSYYRRYPHTC